jgi:hypothetical protein
MSYPIKKINIYSNSDEAAESQAEYIVNQNPIDRIKETVKLILRVYSLSEKRQNTNKIYFDKE